MKRLKSRLIFSCAILATLGITFVLYRINQKPVTLAPGAYARFDDFDFTATSVTPVSQIGSLVSPPASKFYKVTVRVKNSARRVSFTFDPSIVRASIDGLPLTRDDSAEEDLKIAKPAYQLAAGGQSDYTLVFVGPEDAEQMTVSFAFGGAFGEFADAVLLGKSQVVLDMAGA